MTDVSERRRAPQQRPVPVVVAALTTSVWAAVVGAAPVVAVALVAWIADSRSGGAAFGALRFALDGWLLAHGTWLDTSAGQFGLAPLALSILVFRQLSRAGVNSARATGAFTIIGGARVVVAIGGIYACLGALAAWAGAVPSMHAGLAAAAASTGGFAAVASAWGVARVNGIGQQLYGRLPVAVLRAVPSGVIAALTILGAGALLAGACVAFAADDTALLFTAFSPGLIGSATLLALSIVYAPAAAVWGASYLAGPGFAVGSGTSVSALEVSIGPLPAFPLFAALPSGPASGAGYALLAVPLVAGILAGVAAARRSADGEPWSATLVGAALAGPVAGCLLAIAAVAASGPLGGGRMATVGPSAWQLALVTAAEVTLAAVAAAAAVRLLGTLGAEPAPAAASPPPPRTPADDRNPSAPPASTGATVPTAGHDLAE